MSASESTVSRAQNFHPDTQMNLFGWLVFLPLLILLIPLLPVFVLYWLISKATGNA